MAATEVFGIRELCVEILLHLPLRQLLLARAVSKDFDVTILGTKKIRQALWFEPVSQDRLRRGQFHVIGSPQKRMETGWLSDNCNLPVAPIVNPFVPHHRKVSPSLYARQWYARKENGMFLGAGEQLHFVGEWLYRPSSINKPCARLTAAYGQPVTRNSDLPEKYRQLLHGTKGTFKDMTLTHPPVQELVLRPDYARSAQEYVRIKMREISLHSFFTAAYKIKDGVNIGIQGGEEWRLLARTVDEITGWEMLEVLHADPSTFKADMFVRPRHRRS